MDETNEARALLVDLLHEAAQLEHCLLNAYLYTASTIKSTPQEFATIGDQDNRRRALQYERARAWKQSMLGVAHEEMLHLHYVQCLLRALGAAPAFVLPNRDPATGNWIIPNWKARVGGTAEDDGKGMEVPVEPLTPGNIRRFVLYETTDAVQDDDPFGPRVRDLFDRLYAFELDLHLESILFYVADPARRAELKQQLHDLYTTLTPLPPEAQAAGAARELAALPPVEELHFQSIADFYCKGILPLYEQAFDFGWVAHANRNLTNELLNPNYAAEGFLPIGPIYRDKNFEKFAQANTNDPLRNYKHVSDIVAEIVEEGEGATDFEGRATALLAKVQDLGGARAYLQALMADAASSDPTPAWLADAQSVRVSHLYRFAMIMAELNQEQDLARESGVDFVAARPPIAVQGSVPLTQLTGELPAQFNAAYLALVVWLSRIYEIPHWLGDTPRREAIEMLASWPLMSMSVRPFLELASFLPIQLNDLFRLDAAALPLLPIHAQQLYQLYINPERSETINDRMDYLVMRVLTDVAAWAASQQDVVAGADLPANTSAMMQARLRELAQLAEFQKQFPFREHGGYSNIMPDLTYQQAHPDGEKFEEDPAAQSPLYQDTLALRLRFAGWGLVQLATDPDPPYDEVGCTGTHMLHAADGDRRFNRSLVWQNDDPDHTILREPRTALPALGVNCTEIALVVTNGSVSAGYVPLQVMQSAGAVQTSGVQQDLQVQGFLEVLTLTPPDILDAGRQIRLDLLAKDGIKPFLNGNNHLIWRDGEPIDPFILAVQADPPPTPDGAPGPALLFQREVFNEGRSMLEMEPLQRLESEREPCGFDSITNIPPWAQSALPEEARQQLNQRNFAPLYLAQRAGVLAQALAAQLDSAVEQSQLTVDAVVSFAERMSLVSVPRGTTVAWLNFLLHYGHTVSGEQHLGSGANPIFAAVAARTQLQLGLANGANRNTPNARWLVKYTQGMMDTDALSDFVFGELYVPVTIAAPPQPLEFARRWTFPESMHSAVAQYACRFANPFWAPFKVQGNVRTLTLPDGTVIAETLRRAGRDFYSYRMTGIQGVDDYNGSFTLTVATEVLTLEWKFSFMSVDAQTIVRVLSLNFSAAQQMTAKMVDHFGPSSAG